MKRPVFAILTIILTLVIVGCSFPGAKTPLPEIPFPTKEVGVATATLALPLPTKSVNTGAATPNPNFATVAAPVTQFVVDPAGVVAENPVAGKSLVPGVKYNLLYPGQTKAGIGIWFWIAKQYGTAIPNSDMQIKSSRYTQAYLFWIGESKNPSAKFDFKTYYESKDKAISFVFFLPK